MQHDTPTLHTDYLIIGAGLTGLTTAHQLVRRGQSVHLLEAMHRPGGQIHTHRKDGFVYESGPNTGMIAHPEVAELFADLGGDILEIAKPSAQRRLIYKQGRFRPLPSGMPSAIGTDLFTLRDKLRLLGEPWRPAGTDPNESIADLVRRRLGTSYFDYAVDPFIGGIYAGDSERLVTRHALPKLYALEHNHGSFIRGALAKIRAPRTERDRLATRQTFSARGGLSTLVEALASAVGSDRITLGADIVALRKLPTGLWQAEVRVGDYTHYYTARHIVTCVGTEELARLLPDAPSSLIADITAMRYAPVVQVAVGYQQTDIDFDAFGGLVPSREDRHLLGVLNPSAGFEGRAPKGGMLLAIFLGGMRAPDVIGWSDEDIRAFVVDSLRRMLSITQLPDLLEISRHPRAIPQYEASTDARLEAIAQLEAHYGDITIAGNMHSGIGMADRIRQASTIAERLHHRL